MAGGLDVLTGGTDTHLLQLDLRRTEWTGKDAEERLHAVKLTTNRNTVPFDERPPTIASGVRIGTPAATMRGFDEDDFREVGQDHRRRARRRGGRPGARGAQRGALRAAAALPGLPRVHEVRGVSGTVVEVDHPLVRHKLGLLRDVTTTTADVPPARQRADAAPDLRGDEDAGRRGGRDRDAARADERTPDLAARRSPSARSCARASGCSTACCP